MQAKFPRHIEIMNSSFSLLLAIDPGKNGAIAWQCNGAPRGVARLAVEPADLVTQLEKIPQFDSSGRRICFLEAVGGYVGRPQPGSAMFKFGRQFGVIEGTLAALGIEIYKIRPQKWQKVLSAGSRRLEARSVHKRRLRALALELYPGLRRQITLQTADALLILHVAAQLLS
jgi:hypothetical protein